MGMNTTPMNRTAKLSRWAYGRNIEIVELPVRQALREAKKFVESNTQRPLSRIKIWRKPNGDDDARAITDYTCLPNEGVGAKVWIVRR
jgi:hypothetical protein